MDGRHGYEDRLHALEQAILALGGAEFPALRHVGLARVEDALGAAGLMATVGLAPDREGRAALDGFRLSRKVNHLATLHGIGEHVQLRTLVDEDFVRLAAGTGTASETVTGTVSEAARIPTVPRHGTP